MKYLLDTNVFIHLVTGRLASEKPDLEHIAKHSPGTFHTCDLVFQEIAAHLVEEEAEKFSRYRDALAWMETLVGNNGMAPRFPTPLRVALQQFPVWVPEQQRVLINQIRRKLIKCRTFDDIDQDLRNELANVRKESKRQRDEWVVRCQRMANIVLGKEKIPEEERRLEDEGRPVVDVVVQRLLEHFALWWASEGPVRDYQDMKRDLREWLHAHAGQMVKIGSPRGYSFKKHKNDYFDFQILTFCAMDYVIVTSDGPLIDTVVNAGKCPNSRVRTVQQALSELGEVGH